MDYKVFDTLLEPVFVIDAKKCIVYCNEVASLLAESSTKKILRQKRELDSLFIFSDPVSCLGQLLGLEDPSPYQEVSFTTESGITKKAQITAQPIENGMYLIFFRDVTLEETLQKKYRAELEQKEDVIKDLQKAQLELQNYSKNLESMVEERTYEVKKLNQLMSALLNSLGQGFFVFDKSGLCLDVHSKACLNTVETSPPGKWIWDILKVEPRQVEGFKKWMLTAFSEMLPFEDLTPLAPQTFTHSQNLSIKLEYYPIRSESQEIESIVVVATDITAVVEAQREAEKEKAKAKMIISLIEHNRELKLFIREAEEILQELKTQIHQSSVSFSDVFRALHTLKGGASSFSIQNIVDLCHEAESLISEAKEDPSKMALLKALCLQIEPSFENFLSENSLVIGDRSRWEQRWVELPVSKVLEFSEKIKDSSVQRKFLEYFLYEPIGPKFENFKELIQTVATAENKKVKPLQINGGDLMFYPEPYSSLLSNLVHAFRNAVDHGIESVEQRIAANKPEEGQISVYINKYNDKTNEYLRIQIKDDGQGINPERIKSKWIEKGKDPSQLSENQIIQLIFEPEFSTKEGVSLTSGRGVGMDAIAIAAKNIGGKAWVESKVGEGTLLIIEVPWVDSPQRKLKAA